MKLVIVPAALVEVQEATSFYADSANRELGMAFVAEFEKAVNTILGNPRMGALFRGTQRRYLLRRFPYTVIYQSSSDEL